MDAKEITDALATVKDSYFSKDIITLGYVKGMSIGDENLRFSLRLPAPLMRDHDELAQKCKIALKNIEGINMTEFGLLQRKGIVGFTDGYKSIQNTRLMSRIIRSAFDLNSLVMHY